MLYVTYCARRYGMGRDQAFSVADAGHHVPRRPAAAAHARDHHRRHDLRLVHAHRGGHCGLRLGHDPRRSFLYRSLSFKQFYKVTMDTIETTAGVLLIVGAASLFGWVLTTTRLTEHAAEALLSLHRPIATSSCCSSTFCCWWWAASWSPSPSISILVPMLMPVIAKVGIDPVHFGVMMTLNLMIGLLHPPLGMVLFVLARISKMSVERTTMAILPWLIPLLASLVAITLIPELTLWLPRMRGSSNRRGPARQFCNLS